ALPPVPLPRTALRDARLQRLRGGYEGRGGAPRDVRRAGLRRLAARPPDSSQATPRGLLPEPVPRRANPLEPSPLLLGRRRSGHGPALHPRLHPAHGGGRAHPRLSDLRPRGAAALLPDRRGSARLLNGDPAHALRRRPVTRAVVVRATALRLLGGATMTRHEAFVDARLGPPTLRKARSGATAIPSAAPLP